MTAIDLKRAKREADAKRPWRLRRTLQIAVGSLLALWLMNALARQTLYPAPHHEVPSPPPAPLEEVILQSAMGDAIVGWLVRPNPQSTAGKHAGSAILYLHGNGENLATLEASGLFDELGADRHMVLAIDYPGYGRSSGQPSGDSLVAAASAALDWLVDHSEGRPIAIGGWSLGAAVAAQVSCHQQVETTFLASPWHDLSSVAQRHFPAWLVRIVLRDRYHTGACAAQISGRVLVVHGRNDALIPFDHGQRVAEVLDTNAAVKSRFVAIEAGHNDLFRQPQSWLEIHRFLDQTAP